MAADPLVYIYIGAGIGSVILALSTAAVNIITVLKQGEMNRKLDIAANKADESVDIAKETHILVNSSKDAADRLIAALQAENEALRTNAAVQKAGE